jgi:hypothetical protein
MSPRKPTIDGLDDIDDEDGVAEEEAAEDTDLTLHEEEDVGLGRHPLGEGDPYLNDDRKEDEA